MASNRVRQRAAACGDFPCNSRSSGGDGFLRGEEVFLTRT
jgi:hypothetical protein